MSRIINSNCKRCPDFEKKNCLGDLKDCLCRFCPRNFEMCIKVRWCRETESPMDNLWEE